MAECQIYKPLQTETAACAIVTEAYLVVESYEPEDWPYEREEE
jgi:hypothetical protein